MIPVSKKEFQLLKEKHDHLEEMVFHLAKRLQELEKEKKPKYFG